MFYFIFILVLLAQSTYIYATTNQYLDFTARRSLCFAGSIPTWCSGGWGVYKWSEGAAPLVFPFFYVPLSLFVPSKQHL